VVSVHEGNLERCGLAGDALETATHIVMLDLSHNELGSEFGPQFGTWLTQGHNWFTHLNLQHVRCSAALDYVDFAACYPVCMHWRVESLSWPGFDPNAAGLASLSAAELGNHNTRLGCQGSPRTQSNV
jgi:hypothetical protein